MQLGCVHFTLFHEPQFPPPLLPVCLKFPLLIFKITASSETLVLKNLEEILDREPLIIEARKQVEQDMAIQLTFNVNPTAGVGGKLLASVKYAANVDASAGKWKEAKWTDGLAQEAFIHALDLVRHARYDAMEFEVGVAVTK